MKRNENHLNTGAHPTGLGSTSTNQSGLDSSYGSALADTYTQEHPAETDSNYDEGDTGSSDSGGYDSGGGFS